MRVIKTADDAFTLGLVGLERRTAGRRSSVCCVANRFHWLAVGGERGNEGGRLEFLSCVRVRGTEAVSEAEELEAAQVDSVRHLGVRCKAPALLPELRSSSEFAAFLSDGAVAGATYMAATKMVTAGAGCWVCVKRRRSQSRTCLSSRGHCRRRRSSGVLCAPRFRWTSLSPSTRSARFGRM